MPTGKVERINFSDFSRTRTLADQALDARAQTVQGTHVHRLLGIIDSGEELAMLETSLEAGDDAAARLLTQKLFDIVDALDTFCSITVATDSDDPSDFDGGEEINALSDFMSAQSLGNDVATRIYPTTAEVDDAIVDPSYN